MDAHGRLATRTRKAAQRRYPRFEGLEERVLLESQFVDLGPLRIGADSFQQSGSNYTASGTIEVGFIPSGGESYEALIAIEGAVSFTVGGADPALNVTDAQIEAPASGGSAQIPLAEVTGTWVVNVGLLVGAGVSLEAPGVGAHGVAVAGATLTPSTLALADADSDEVRLQGDLAFVPLVGVSVPVQGEAYVAIVDGQATLTTIDSQPVDGSFTLYGVSFASTGIASTGIKVSYATQDSFTFQGGVSVTTADHGLDGVSATLDLELAAGVVSQANLTDLATFELFHLNATAADGFTFVVQGAGFAAFGDVTLTIPGAAIGGSVEPISATLGSSSAPGLVIGSDGVVQSIGMTISGEFVVFGLSYQAQDVIVIYEATNNEYAISGSVHVPILFNATATLGTAQHSSRVSSSRMATSRSTR